MASSKPKILVLSSRFPFPVIGGDKIRIYHICKALSLHFDLTLVSLCGSRAEMHVEAEPGVFSHIHRVYHPWWKAWGQTLRALLFSNKPLQVGYYESARMREVVDAQYGKHDLVLAHLTRTAQFIDARQDRPHILELTDALSLGYDRIKTGDLWLDPRALIYWIEKKRILEDEVRLASSRQSSVLISPIDKAYLQDKAGEVLEQVHVIGPGIIMEHFPWRMPAQSPVVGFVGNMRALHNEEACTYFAQEVLPLVRKAIPDVRFRVIGQAPAHVRRRLRSLPNVDLTGTVPSVSDELAKCFCAVNPIHHGAGAKGKVLEYMAAGLPVVSTEMGCDWMEPAVREAVLLAESPALFAEHVVRLYRDQAERERLSRLGRERVEATYRFPVLEDRYVALAHHLLGVPHPEPAPSAARSTTSV